LLERQMPEGHLLRAIDRFVDLGRVRAHLAPFYSETGRPSYLSPTQLRRRRGQMEELKPKAVWFGRLGMVYTLVYASVARISDATGRQDFHE